jgi:hypothetical protein
MVKNRHSLVSSVPRSQQSGQGDSKGGKDLIGSRLPCIPTDEHIGGSE